MTQTRNKQLKQHIARSALCLVMVNMLKTLLVIPPYRRMPVAAMLAQLHKTAAIERKKVCIRCNVTCPHCAQVHMATQTCRLLWHYTVLADFVWGGVNVVQLLVIGCARARSRVITWLAHCVLTVSCVVQRWPWSRSAGVDSGCSLHFRLEQELESIF